MAGRVQPPGPGIAEQGSLHTGNMAVRCRPATIVKSDSSGFTYRLVDNRKNVVENAVPFGNSGGARGEGKLEVYEQDTPVILFEIPGAGSYFLPVEVGSWGPQLYETDDGENLFDTGIIYDSENEVSHRGTRPHDMQPGDWARRGVLGNTVAVLKNGLSMLRGSRAAEIILNGLEGVIQVVSRKYVHITPFGKIEIDADPNTGSTSLRIRGRSNSAYQGQGNYQIAVDLGASGGAIKAEVRDNNGTPVGRFQIKPDGSMDIMAPPGELNEAARAARRDIGGEFTETIRGETVRSYGAHLEESGSSRKTTMSGVDEGSADSYRRSANKSMELTAGTLSVSASPALLDPSALTQASVAHDVNVSNGSFKIAVGSTTDVSAKSSYTCDVKNGNVTFSVGSQTPTAAFKVKCGAPSSKPQATLLPTEGSVGDPNANLSAATGILLGTAGKPLFPFLKTSLDFNAFMTALAKFCDLHVHPFVGLAPGIAGATSPPTPMGDPILVGWTAEYTKQTVGAAVLGN